ncbi:MAG: hypothetical protein B6D59_06625 [Campylobacteraceae bacterium 4484_4]|nr:MAG: hypothetical protein B6D59_06625 [Campylobacteraceae bacterium 4484_4]
MWKKILGGFLIFIALLIALVFYATSGMTEVAEQFFTDIKSGQIDKAYASLSEDFKRSTTKEQLLAFLKQTGLDHYKSASWGERGFEGKRGTLEGSITTDSGGTIPVTINFIEGEEGWKIYYIGKPGSGAAIEKEQSKSQSTAAPAISDHPEYKQLVHDTIHLFGVSIKQKSMVPLYESAAQEFREHVTLEQMNEAYKDFIKAQLDMSILDRMSPIFDTAPRISNDGRILHLKGHYDTHPSKASFDLRYLKKNGLWKLTGIDISVE